MSDGEAKAKLTVLVIGLTLILGGTVAWDMWSMKATAVASSFLGAMLFWAAATGGDE